MAVTSPGAAALYIILGFRGAGFVRRSQPSRLIDTSNRVSLFPRRRSVLSACPWALSSQSMGDGEWHNYLTIMIVI
jgi:hypothetical protein